MERDLSEEKCRVSEGSVCGMTNLEGEWGKEERIYFLL